MRKILGLIMLAPAGAFAGPILWTLQGFTFDDGGTASGSFMFDAATGLYSSINITTSNGSVLSGSTYAFVDPGNAGFNGPSEIFMVASSAPDLTGSPFLGLIWQSNLTGGGGTVPLSSSLNSGETKCTNSGCTSINQLTGRLLTGGSVTTGAGTVPEPATFVLVGCALAAVGLKRRVHGALTSRALTNR